MIVSDTPPLLPRNGPIVSPSSRTGPGGPQANANSLACHGSQKEGSCAILVRVVSFVLFF